MQKRVSAKMASRCDRLKKKRKLEEDLEEYYWLNSIAQMYPHTSFDATEYALPSDPKLEGDKKQKNKISARNSRKRVKRRNEELNKRIQTLRKETDLRYIEGIHHDLDIAVVYSHDMFVKKLDELYLPEQFLDIPVNLSDFEI